MNGGTIVARVIGTTDTSANDDGVLRFNTKKTGEKEPKDEKKISRFSGGLEAFKKARAMSPSAQPKPDPDAPLAPAKVEIPGFPKAMAGVQVFKPEKMDVNVDSVDIAGKFDLANLAKEMMDRRKRVERWRREQKRKGIIRK